MTAVIYLRGSTVTMGETATRLPSSLAVSSGGIGWAWTGKNKIKIKENKRKEQKIIEKTSCFEYRREMLIQEKNKKKLAITEVRQTRITDRKTSFKIFLKCIIEDCEFELC